MIPANTSVLGILPSTKEEAGAFESWISLVNWWWGRWGTLCLPLPPCIAFHKENLTSRLSWLVESLMQHGAESSQPEFASPEVWLYEPGSPFYPSRPKVVPVGYLCGQPLMTSFYYIRKWGKCVE